MVPNNKQFQTLPKKPFFKTPAGMALIGLGSIVALFALGFAGLTGYYFFKIKTGTAGEIAQQLTGGFTSGGSGQQRDVTLGEVQRVIRSHSPQTGSGKEAVTVLAFIDFECPFCQQSYSIFSEVAQQYSSGINVVFKHFPLSSIHPRSVPAAIASSCANEQGSFWKYYDYLFQTKQLDDTNLLAGAQQLGLNMPKFTSCVNSEKFSRNVDQDLNDGFELGVRGTPTYFVNNRKVEGVITAEQWNTILLDEIKNN
jgi:protein-disulfide isomerase